MNRQFKAKGQARKFLIPLWHQTGFSWIRVRWSALKTTWITMTGSKKTTQLYLLKKNREKARNMLLKAKNVSPLFLWANKISLKSSKKCKRLLKKMSAAAEGLVKTAVSKKKPSKMRNPRSHSSQASGPNLNKALRICHPRLHSCQVSSLHPSLKLKANAKVW